MAAALLLGLPALGGGETAAPYLLGGSSRHAPASRHARVAVAAAVAAVVAAAGPARAAAPPGPAQCSAV